MAILCNPFLTHSKPPECKIINGKVVKFSDMVVHQFRIGDIEDPMLYVVDHISQWEQTEAGKFVMENSAEPLWWMQSGNHLWHGSEFTIVARMKESDQTFYTLKYVGTKD
jgi:hypothetical protein